MNDGTGLIVLAAVIILWLMQWWSDRQDRQGNHERRWR